MPIFRIPIHLSYILYLATYSVRLAVSYFRWALWLCRVFKVPPSLLLHPLDFLGCEDEPDLRFFPAMNLPADLKMNLAGRVIELLGAWYRIIPLCEQAELMDDNRSDSRLWCDRPLLSADGGRFETRSRAEIPPAQVRAACPEASLPR